MGYLTKVILFREKKQGGNDEGCIGILNDFYSDGIKWHDIECRHGFVNIYILSHKMFLVLLKRKQN